ncbi:MAG: hypothetical protein H7Z19_19065 [Chitinophagaceae bacterium]|nr:hypothetical protein [Rubrivivax sp.]
MVAIAGTALCHPPSTARIDIETHWDEVIDDGTSPVRTEKRVATAGSVTVEVGTATVPWRVQQTFGDGKRRDLVCHAVASTRFREYFPRDTPAEQLVRRTEQGLTTIAVNTTRPDPIEVHSVVPIFRWSREVNNGVLTSTRRTAGVRVWLQRPWQQTGAGERLGVIIYRDAGSASAAVSAESNETSALHGTATRWCGDPLDGFGHQAGPLVAANFPARIELDQNMPAHKVRPSPGAQLVEVRRDVLGHAVQYDADRDLWWSDIDIEITNGKMYFPFVRLGLVRHQPHAAPGCHFSPIVVTDPVQLPPARTLTAKAVAADKVSVHVTGPWINNSRFAVELLSRAAGPLLGFSADADDLATSASSPHGSMHLLTASIVGDTVTASGQIPVRVNGVPTESAVTRLVLREYQVGESLHGPGEPPSVQPLGPANRAVYVDVIDQALLGVN